MNARRIVAIAAAGALAAGGAGVAIAAVTKDDPGKREDAVLADAAKRLNVTPQKLHDALKAAQDAQADKDLAAAVKRGDLTQKQADAIKKARSQSAHVFGPIGPGGRGHGPGGPGLRGHFGPGPGGPGHFRGPGGPGGPGGGLVDDLAKALGVSDRTLMTQLRQGKSVAAIAKAHGKSLASVRSAVKAAAKTRADKAVKAGDLTRKQADALLARLDEHLKNLGKVGVGPRFRGHHFKGAPPPGGVRPGSFVPAPAAPAPPDQVIQ
jgi:transposase-like protein